MLIQEGPWKEVIIMPKKGSKKKKKEESEKESKEEEINLPEGLELMGGGWGEKLAGWIKENFSSVILPIIALLILGGGIYLYSQNQAQRPAFNQQPAEKIAMEEEATPTPEKAKQKPAPTKKKEEKKEKEEKKVMGGPEQKGKIYKTTAKKGEGITHLARRALRRYLSEHKNAPDLTPEHKIYVEDYLQNRKGTYGLEPGDQLTFSADQISEAISASQNLTQSQLDNLTQYANQVPSLNY